MKGDAEIYEKIKADSVRLRSPHPILSTEYRQIRYVLNLHGEIMTGFRSFGLAYFIYIALLGVNLYIMLVRYPVSRLSVAIII